MPSQNWLTRRGALCHVFIALLALLLALTIGAGRVEADSEDAQAGPPSSRVIIRLSDPPLLASSGSVALSLGEAALTAMESSQDQALARVQATFPEAAVVQRYHYVFNGLAISLPEAEYAARGPVERAALRQSLSALEGVEAVYEESVFHPTLYRSPDAVRADSAWTALGGRGAAGEGVRIAVLDSGIAIDHAMFDPDGYAYPGGYPVGVGGAVSPKVVAARAYYRPDDPPLAGEGGPVPGEADSGHGTHLAGIAAGNVVTESLYGVTPTISGVAPRAYLMNYRIFYPSAETGQEVAYSAEILQAIDDAVADGAQVLLAGWSSLDARMPTSSPVAQALETVMQAGCIVVAPVGNEGPAQGSASRLPGGLERVITVGSQGEPYGEATFGASITTTLGPLTLTRVADVGDDEYACEALPSDSLSGRAALVSRGGCAFVDKAYYAQQAGAVAVVIYNDAETVEEMGCSGGLCDQIDVPVVMVSDRYGQDLVEWLDSGGAVTPTLTLDPAGRVVTESPGRLAPSSGRGPAYMSALKPDLVAPGVSVVSAGTPAEYVALSGSSVAAAHVAGAAALLLEAHPNWTHDEVKSALANAARLDDGDPAPPSRLGVLDRGAGLLDVSASLSSTLTFSPTALAYGSVAAFDHSLELELWDRRETGDVITYTFAASASPSESDAYAVSIGHPPTVTLAPGERQTVLVYMTPSLSAPAGHWEGRLDITGGGKTWRVPIWGHVREKPTMGQVLVLDNDFVFSQGIEGYCHYVTQTLSTLGVSYDVVNVDQYLDARQTLPDLATLQEYQVVIWVTGEKRYPDGYFAQSTPLTPVDQQLLADYLHSGGRLLAMGQNLAQASDVNGDDDDPTWGRSTLYHGYLGAHWLQDNVYHANDPPYPPASDVGAQGLPGTFLSDVELDLGLIGDGAKNMSSVDEIGAGGLPDGSDEDLVQPILRAISGSSQEEGYLGMIKYDDPRLEDPVPDIPYRVLYYSFGLEGINDTEAATRESFLQRSLNWLRDNVSVDVLPVFMAGPNCPCKLHAQGYSGLERPFVKYRWRIGEGAGADIVTSQDNDILYTFDTVGERAFMVEATDDLGHSAVDGGTVRVVPGGGSALIPSDGTLQVGDIYSYTLTLRNCEVVSRSMEVTFTLPINADYLAHEGGSYADGKLTWAGTLEPGEERELWVRCQVEDAKRVEERPISLDAEAHFLCEGYEWWQISHLEAEPGSEMRYYYLPLVFNE